MNTFLVSNDHGTTARCLDHARLNRQISDCIQIARLLFVYDSVRRMFSTRTIPFGITFSSVIRLWIIEERGIEKTLIPELREYFNALNEEWRRHNGVNHKSYDNFVWDRFISDEVSREIQIGKRPYKLVWPVEVLQSHRSHLMAKDYTHYYHTFSSSGVGIVESGMIYEWKSPVIIEVQK